MPTSDPHLMWDYQALFRASQHLAARRLFQALDPRFRPEVFLVGVPSQRGDRRPPPAVEPEDDFWLAPADLDEAPALAAQALLEYAEPGLRHAHPLAQQWHEDDPHRRSVRDAVLKIVSAHPAHPERTAYWASLPVKVDRHWVSVVVGLQDPALARHYSLKTTEAGGRSLQPLRVPASFVEAAMQAFHERAASELARPDAGRASATIDVDEVLRTAGNFLMSGIVLRVDPSRYDALQTLFRSCSTVSSLHYERKQGTGTILLARRGHPSVESAVSFASPARLDNYRGARKLLQLASQELPLHSNTEEIFGLARIKDYDQTREDLFEVHMLDHHYWELAHAGQALMRVRYGQPALPASPFQEGKLRLDLPRIFKAITPEQVARLTDLVAEAEHASHGTMLLITEDAAGEAKRLNTQGTPLAPCRLTPRLLGHLTPIDGALIISPDGVCHAIGTILDGRASEKGDPNRGARYNSAVRYVETSVVPCLAIVVSEDGGVDFVPDLRPAIRRSEIDRAIAALAELSQVDPPPRRKFGELLDWVNEHRFYLLAEHCEVLNRVVPDIVSKFWGSGGSRSRVMRASFAPSPKMDSAVYYLPEPPQA